MKRRRRTKRRRRGDSPHVFFYFLFLILWLTINSMLLVGLLLDVDINHFIRNACNLSCWIIFWYSMYVRGSMVNTYILKYNLSC